MARTHVMKILDLVGVLVCLAVIKEIWDEGYQGYAVALCTALILVKLTSWIKKSNAAWLAQIRTFISSLPQGVRFNSFVILVVLVSARYSEPSQIMRIALVTVLALLVYVFYLRLKQTRGT